MATRTRAIVAMGFAAAAACSGRQQAEEVIEVYVPPDIPGLDPRAAQAFVDGMMAMQEVPVDYETALASFEEAAAIDEDFWEAWENVGLIQMDLGRYADAIATFEREQAVVDDLIVRGWPVEPRPEILLNIGKAHALAGNFAEAAESFAALLAIDPENVEAIANLAALHADQGNFEQSRTFIGELLQMSQNDVGALNVLARIYRDEGDLQMARYLWEKCLGVISETTTQLEDEAQYEGLGEDETFRLRTYNTHRIGRLGRLRSDVENELGIAAWRDGDFDTAERFFRNAVEDNPYNYGALSNLGAVYLEYGFFEDACGQFGEALALRPRNEDPMVGLATCTYGMGEIETAYALYQEVLAAHSRNAFATEQLANIAFQDLGDQDAALDWCQQNLTIRGLTMDTCDRSADRMCALCNSIIEIRSATGG